MVGVVGTSATIGGTVDTALEISFSVLSDNDDAGRHTAVISLEDGHTGNEVLSEAISSGFSVCGFKELVPRMNDIFIKLVTEEE